MPMALQSPPADLTPQQIGKRMTHYIDQILAGFQIKALVSTIPALFTTYLGGDWYIFEIWFLMNFIDLICGVIVAQKYAVFSRIRVYGWVVKTLTHVLTIIFVGLASAIFSSVSGYPLPILDWVLFILVLTEMASIIDSFVKLNLPVPALCVKIISKIRHRAEKKIDDILNKPGGGDDSSSL